MIRRPAPLAGVVADPGLLLEAVDDQHGGVHVEDQPAGDPRLDGHALQEAILPSSEFRERRRGRPQQEAAERGRLGITRQARQVLKDAILAEQLRGFEAFQAEDHRVEQRQQHLADAVAVVPLGQRHMPGDGGLKSNARQEAMQEIDAPVMRQVLRPNVMANPRGPRGI